MKKASQSPRVLVVIATLGQRANYLEETLKSVRTQSYLNIDIVLVYPSKSSETKKLAKKYKAYSIEDPGSMSGAVNLGIQSADPKHSYVTWIGDDDLLEPDMVKTSVKALEAKPESPASFGFCHYINENGKHIFTSRAGNLAPWIMTWGPNLVPLPGSMYRLSSLRKLDYMFDTSLKYAMDLDLFLRLRKLGPLLNVGIPVASFRWHSSSTTVAYKAASLREAEMIKRRYLPSFLRPVSHVWDIPVRIASHIAAKRVAKMAE